MGLRVATVDYESLLLKSHTLIEANRDFSRKCKLYADTKSSGLGEAHPVLQGMKKDRLEAQVKSHNAAIRAREEILAAIQQLGRQQSWDMIVAKKGATENCLGELEGRSDWLMVAQKDVTDDLRQMLRW